MSQPISPPTQAAEGAGTTFVAPDGKCFNVRPLQESDECLVGDFLKHADAEDVRLRFFVPVRTFDHRFLWPLVHYDHDQAVAFVAMDATDHPIAGVARLHCDVLRTFGEFAIFVRGDLKRQGLGRFLMQRLIEWAQAGSIPLIKGEILRENTPMIALCRGLGFRILPSHNDPVVVHAELRVPPDDRKVGKGKLDSSSRMARPSGRTP